MTPAKFTARAVLAGITLAALGLVVATPAAAHTNNLYSLVYNLDPNWAILDRTNGSATLLPQPAANGREETVGAEIYNEIGYAILDTSDGEDTHYSVINWDHTTGAETAPVPITFPGADALSYVSGLDTLADGTLLTYIEYEILEDGSEFPEFRAAIAILNPTTGVLSNPVFLQDVIENDDFSFDVFSLATDPTSGTTYLFLRDDNTNFSYFLPVNFTAGTYTDPVRFEGSGFEAGIFGGADFDQDGTLYFIYGNIPAEVYELSRIGVASSWPGAERQIIGEAAGNFDNLVDPLNLTLEYTAPALAETGTESSAGWFIAASVAVLAGVVTVVSTRRRTGAVV